MTRKPRRRSKETTIASLVDWWKDAEERRRAAEAVVKATTEELESLSVMLATVAPSELEKLRQEASGDPLASG
jgi:hypothetical protein